MPGRAGDSKDKDTKYQQSEVEVIFRCKTNEKRMQHTGREAWPEEKQNNIPTYKMGGFWGNGARQPHGMRAGDSGKYFLGKVD